MNKTLVLIAEKTIKLVNDSDLMNEHEPEDIVIGLFYSAIKTRKNVMGLSYTLFDVLTSKKRFQTSLEGNLLINKSLRELTHYVEGDLGIFRTIGLAAINTLAQSTLDLSNSVNKNILEICDVQKHDKVAMIGNIRPISKELKTRTNQIYILDNYDSYNNSKDIYQILRIEDLPDVQHMFVSGSALVFDNIDEIIFRLKKVEGEKVLIGPSAQINPSIAFNLGFTIVASSIAISPSSILNAIKQGGTYHYFKKYMQKYVFIR